MTAAETAAHHPDGAAAAPSWPATPFAGRRIVLGVTGSIACYKALDLASKLTQAGALVDVILSYGAAQFVTPLAFRSLTHRPVVTDAFDAESEYAVEHITLARAAEVLVVAPATVHVIARLALGLADDALTTTAVATAAPLVVAPAMDGGMFEHPATQENLATLRRRGAVIAGPGGGRLASGLYGAGRLLETPELLGHIAYALGRDGDLAGRRLLISAGGTREPIDPVRVITNHSSGKMGYALAEAARDRGAQVTLVSAAALPPPPLVELAPVTTAAEMGAAVLERLPQAEALIMAAAVADYTPADPAQHKLKKSDAARTIALTPTADILRAAGAPIRDGSGGSAADGSGGGSPAGSGRAGRFVKVGFAAESDDLLSNARAKVAAKDLDLIVANDITDPGSGFGSDDNRVTIIDRQGQAHELPLLPKYAVAHAILDRVAALLPPGN